MSTGGGGDNFAGGVYGEFGLDLGPTEQKLSRARAGMADAASQMARLETAFRAGAIGVDRLDSEMDALIAHKAALAAQVADLTARLQRESQAMQQVAVQSHQVNTGMAAVHGGSSKAALGLLAVGQAVDDAQYGFRGIANNLPQIAMMFGAGAGVGGAVAIAATAVNQLVQHWDDLSEAMEISPARTAVERMHDLAAATHEAAEAQEKLNEAKEREQRIAALGKKRTEGQEATAQGVGAAIAGAGDERGTGFNNILKGLMDLRSAQGLNPQGDPAGKFSFWRTVKDAIGSQDPGGAMGRERQRIREEFNQDNLRRAKEDIDAAQQDPAKLKSLIETIRRNPTAFQNPQQLLKDLTAQTPEGAAARQQEEIDNQERRAARKAEIEAEKKLTAQVEREQKERETDWGRRQKQLGADAKRLATKQQDEFFRQVEEETREAPEKARGADFAVAPRAREQMRRDVLGGGMSIDQSVAGIARMIEDELKALGFNNLQAQEAGRVISKEEGERMRKEEAEALFKPEREERRKSQTVASASFWETIQGSIGQKDDVQQKQLEHQALTSAAVRELVALQQRLAGRRVVAELR